MNKKIIIIVLVYISLSSIFFSFWYFATLPKLDVLKSTSQKFGGALAYGTGIPISPQETQLYINSLDKYEWLSGVCSPFQQNIQSVLLTYKKDQTSQAYVQVYLLDKPDGKVTKEISFNSSKSWDQTVSYIKSNCLADIFDNKEKYSEIYLNDDFFKGLNGVDETDYAVEYEKYLFQKEQTSKSEALCGNPNIYFYWRDNRTMPRKTTEEEFRLCLNALNGEKPDLPIERTLTTPGADEVMRAIEASNK